MFLMDSDIAIKASSYSVLDQVIQIVAAIDQPYMLSVAKTVISERLHRRIKRGMPASILTHFNQHQANIQTTEPNEKEIELAAELEESALKLKLSLDIGESQLIAIILTRGYSRLATGDKRAITAAEALFNRDNKLQHLLHKLVCLEQIIGLLASQIGALTLRSCVCASPGVDIAMAIIFSCGGGTTNAKNIAEGIQSYIGSLAAIAPNVMDASFGAAEISTLQ